MDGITHTDSSHAETLGPAKSFIREESGPVAIRSEARRRSISAARLAAACLRLPKEAAGVIRVALSVCREFKQRSDFLKAGGDIGLPLLFRLEDLDRSIESFTRTLRSIT